MANIRERTVVPAPVGYDTRPVPDPTVLTTQQLLREIASVREILEARLDGMDKGISLVQAAFDKSPTIAELNARFEEKFNSIRIQFAERDIRTEQTARDSKVAVDAALQAAKEAVGEQNKSSSLAIQKSETGTTKQIDQITTLISTGQSALNDKIDDIKDRLTQIEGRSKGLGDGWGYLVGGIGLLMGIGSLVISVVIRMKQ